MEKVEEKDNENFDKIKVISSEDEKLKILGELLSNKSSRDIIKLLMGKEMYTNEIADKLDLRANLVIHHLKKLEELGLLEITHKTIVKKGNNHRYFRMIPHLFVVPNHTKEDLKKKGILEKIFKEGIKFASVVVVGITIWGSMKYYNSQNKNESPSHSGNMTFNEPNILSQITNFVENEILNQINEFILIPIIMIVGASFLIWFSRKYK